MRSAGGERPIIASEVSGPGFFEIRSNRRFAGALFGPAGGPAAVRRLRQSLADLPVEARMFLDTPSSDAGRLLLRIQADDMMVRNMLALAAGVERAAWFDIWHDDTDPDAPTNIINSPTGLFEGTPQALGNPNALGSAFGRMAQVLGSATSVVRASISGTPDTYAYRITRKEKPALLVAWRRPQKRGDILAPATVTLPRSGIDCRTLTIDGSPLPAKCSSNSIRLALTEQPVIIGRL